MANVRLQILTRGGTSTAFRDEIKSASWMREELEFIDPYGHHIPVPARVDIAQAIDAYAKANNLPITHTGDYLGEFEKDNALRLRTLAGWQTSIRDKGKGSEWDTYTLSMDGVSEADAQTIAAIIPEAMRSPDGIASTDKGGQGKRAVLVSKVHTNTGHGHLHIAVSRLAFDVQKREISNLTDLSKTGVVESMLQRLTQALQDGGIEHVALTFNTSTSTITNNAIQREAAQAQAEALTQAGSLLPGQRAATVSVGGVPIELNMAATAELHTTDALKRMAQQRREAAAKAQAEAEEYERVAQVAEQGLLATAALESKVQENESLVKAAEQAAQQMAEQAATIEALEAQREQLTQQVVKLNTANLDAGQRLIPIAARLGITVSHLEAGTIAPAIDQAVDFVQTWGEALDSLDDDDAAVLADPATGLVGVFEKLKDATKDGQALREKLKEAEDRQAMLESAINDQHQQFMEMEQQHTKASVAANIAQEKAKALEVEMAALTERLKAAQESQAREAEAKDHARTQAANAAAKAARLEGALEATQAQAAQAEERAEKMREAYDKMKGDHDRLHAQLHTYQAIKPEVFAFLQVLERHSELFKAAKDAVNNTADALGITIEPKRARKPDSPTPKA